MLLLLEELGTGELMEEVTRMVGKYTKTIQDVAASFHLWVKATVGLLESLKPATKGVEESEKSPPSGLSSPLPSCPSSRSSTSMIWSSSPPPLTLPLMNHKFWGKV